MDRINWMKGAAIIFAITEAARRLMGLDYQRFLFAWGPAPTYLSPPGQVIAGTYQYLVANSDWQRAKAKRRIKYSYKAFIPGSMAWRDLARYMKGETTLKEFLLYTKPKDEPKIRPLRR